ncbi:MAG: SDR family NAD(P)-dependent oxidoreductase [Bryobacteraceae bacterium]|nr:SDR family NAD(P)-dependent oxidoreductase [Bryobacteraceae bacterium]
MANARETTKTLAIAAAAGFAFLIARAAVQRQREYDFKGKVVLITGSSRGLGLVIARQLAGEGARLVICARDADELEAARAELSSHGADVFAIACDLAKPDEANTLVDRAIEHFGGIDVLINNAGTIKVSPIEHITMEDYHYAMDTNFWAAVNVAYRVVPHMQERRSGRIANISSVAGKIGVPHMIPYCAGKHALVGWSRGLRTELAKDNVLVTTICPGLMRTGSPRNAEFKGRNTAEYAWFKVADSLPVISTAAETAAQEILAAVRRGDVERIIGGAARAGVFIDQFLPEWSGELASIAGRLLPGPGGVGTETRRGAESESPLSRSALTSLTQEAELENNEIAR